MAIVGTYLNFSRNTVELFMFRIIKYSIDT
jgi:hypothetical protein